MFQRATKKQSRLRMALIGPAGSGKTFTALSLAQSLGSQIAVIDTEHGSASKYSDLFAFDVCELTSFSPDTYIQAIRVAEQAGYDVLVIDSLSHAWMGKDGVLEFKDRVGGGFNAWREATPLHNKLVEAILSTRVHVIATMRSKTEYIVEEYEDGGRKKSRPRKIGMQPVQRDGLEYEFDVVADLDESNTLYIGKTRCSILKGQIYEKAGADVAAILVDWLADGVPNDCIVCGASARPGKSFCSRACVDSYNAPKTEQEPAEEPA